MVLNLLFGTTTTFGDVPVDILFGRLDGAAFAVQAVLGVDLQLGRVGLFVLYEFVDLGGTETLFRARKSFQRGLNWDSLHTLFNS